MDLDGLITEANEANNALGPQNITVTPQVDLHIVSVSFLPPTPVEGQPVQVTVQTGNLGDNCPGCPSFNVDFYGSLGVGPVLGQPGDLTCSESVPNDTTDCIAMGVFSSAGVHNAWAQADTNHHVNETNEANNIFGPVVVTVLADSDGDAVADVSGNCPLWSNPLQTLPNYGPLVGTGADSDCDRFTDTRETYLGTDPSRHCSADTIANNEPVDSWPVDINDNRTANTIDVGQFVFSLNSHNNQEPPDPRWNPRHDLNANGIINTIDVGAYVFVLNKTCSPSGP